MDVGRGDQDTTRLNPSEMLMLQSKDMTQFSITDIVLVEATYPKTGLHMMIAMKRKIMSEMMTTYFPSLLLMMITYATTFFKPIFFEAALSVNLTTMLVMTTIFISKMESLPPTSATKMIDYWLILCQLVPFAQVVLLTAMEFLREEGQEEKNVLSKEESSQIEATKEKQQGNLQIEFEDEPKRREAWRSVDMKYSRTSILSMLLVIGKSSFTDIMKPKTIFSEKKVMPLMVLSAFLIYSGIAASFFFALLSQK